MDYNKVYSRVHLREAADRNYNSVLFFMHLWCENHKWDNGFAVYREFCSNANKFHKSLLDKAKKNAEEALKKEGVDKPTDKQIKDRTEEFLPKTREEKGEMDASSPELAKWPLDPKCPLGCANIDCMEWYFWATSYGILKVRPDLDAKKPPTYDSFLSAYFARVKEAYVDAEIAEYCFKSNVEVITKMIEGRSSYATEGILINGEGHDNRHWLEDKYAKSIGNYIRIQREGKLPKNLNEVETMLKEMKSAGFLRADTNSGNGSGGSSRKVSTVKLVSTNDSDTGDMELLDSNISEEEASKIRDEFNKERERKIKLSNLKTDLENTYKRMAGEIPYESFLKHLNSYIYQLYENISDDIIKLELSQIEAVIMEKFKTDLSGFTSYSSNRPESDELSRVQNHRKLILNSLIKRIDDNHEEVKKWF